MARREFLSPVQRAQFLAFPTSQRDLIRFYTFSPSELAWIQKRRGEHNRFGFALQLCFFKYPGRVWALGESVPDELLRYVAQQINLEPAALAGYAQREPTRREHILELQARLGWQRFSGRCYREMKEWLIRPHGPRIVVWL
jgi:TnpA family transposase